MSKSDPSTPDTSETFEAVVRRAISRRGFMNRVLVFGTTASIMGSRLWGAQGSPARAQEGARSTARQERRFRFTPIAAQNDLQVHVPEEFVGPPAVLVRWGDPIFEGVAEEFDHKTGGSVKSSDKVFGENNDGMQLFVHEGRQLLVVNQEYVNPRVNLPQSKGVPTSADEVRKLQNLQGVTVIEIRETESGWEVVKESPYNRRITHHSPMRLAGPAAGHDLLKTRADPTGRRSLGTMNNCGSGRTPWGTYLSCEENVNKYFGSTDAGQSYDPIVQAGYDRYSVRARGYGFDYHKWDERFDTAAHPNEVHRVGWVVEIDPTDPKSTPIKHTGLGRFKHENAECVLARDGRVVVYMGDDEKSEFLYRFVSNKPYVKGEPTEGLLNDGTLSVAKFHDDGKGEWLPLTPESTGMELAEILIFARIAGSRVGATTMDRPEWVAAHPTAPEVYCSLTNNSHRGVRPNTGGDASPVDAANPREINRYGQIVRWYPHEKDHAADTFDWDLFVLAGNPAVHKDAYAGSSNVNPDNMFNSPDGLFFDRNGLLWIQTDGSDSNSGEYAGMGNNQMLVGDPATGEIARFLTGPKGCEVTGHAWSADRRTLFIGIQHPGGSWPDGEGLPRSSIVALKRRDGDAVG